MSTTDITQSTDKVTFSETGGSSCNSDLDPLPPATYRFPPPEMVKRTSSSSHRKKHRRKSGRTPRKHRKSTRRLASTSSSTRSRGARKNKQQTNTSKNVEALNQHSLELFINYVENMVDHQLERVDRARQALEQEMAAAKITISQELSTLRELILSPDSKGVLSAANKLAALHSEEASIDSSSSNIPVAASSSNIPVASATPTKHQALNKVMTSGSPAQRNPSFPGIDMYTENTPPDPNIQHKTPAVTTSTSSPALSGSLDTIQPPFTSSNPQKQHSALVSSSMAPIGDAISSRQVIALISQREADLVRLISQREQEIVRMISTREEELLSVMSQTQPPHEQQLSNSLLDPSHENQAQPEQEEHTSTESKNSSKPRRRRSTAEALSDLANRIRRGSKASLKSASSTEKDTPFSELTKSAGSIEAASSSAITTGSSPLAASSTGSSTLLPKFTGSSEVVVHDQRNWLCTLQFDKQRIVTGCLNGRDVKIYDTNTGRCLNTLTGHQGLVYCIQFRGDRLVTGSGDGTYKIWSLTSGECVQTVKAHSPNGVLCLQFDEEIIVTGCTDREVKVWDIETGENLMELTGHSEAVWTVKFDEKRIASGSEDTTIVVWNRKNGQLLSTLSGEHGHKAPIRCLQFAGNTLVSGSEDCSIKIWGINSGICQRTLEGHLGTVICLQLVGNRIITGSFDSKIKIWNFESGKCIQTLEGHKLGVYCLQFAENMLLSGSEDGTILKWKIEKR